MTSRQLYVMGRCYQNHNFQLSRKKLKKRKVKLKDKIMAYFSKHPLIFWTFAFIGMPIGILLTVASIAMVFNLLIWGLMLLL